MEATNLGRFSIEKDASSYLEKNKIYPIILDSQIAKKEEFAYSYSGDTDFRNYFRTDTAKINEIAKYYPNIELFLKNIHFDAIFANLEKTIISIIEKIVKEYEKKNSLIIINMSPIEAAICGEFFKELGINNLAYNFNRTPFINSSSKTLEAILYLLAYKNSNFFVDLTKKFTDKIKGNKYDIVNEKLFILFDENNNKENYSHLQIDDYLKNQIGFKESKNIYRIDKYPSKDFLNKKSIEKIIILDNDNDIGSMIKYYIKNLEEVKFPVKIIEGKYELTQIKNIGYFEDYLLKQNEEYLKYKGNIENKLNNSDFVKKINENESKKNSRNEINTNDIYNINRTNSNYEKLKKDEGKIKDKTIVPYLIMFPILLIAFLASDLNGGSYYNSGTSGTSSNGGIFIGGNSYGTSNNSSISTNSSKSSSSIIKSFGGGGFSKGSSS